MKSGAVTGLVGVFALVAGLVIGGLGPRAQVHALEKQLAEAAECKGSQMGSELANVFRGRPWEDGEEPRRRVRRIRTPEQPEPAEPVEEAKPEGIQIQIGDDQPELDPEELSESLEMAREALELRYTQARAALLQDADPTDEQLEVIDASVARMNDDLVTLARDLAEKVRSGEQPERRETMEFAAETLDVLLVAEDDLRNALTPEQIGRMQDASLDPMSYVDPSLIDILGDLNR